MWLISNVMTLSSYMSGNMDFQTTCSLFPPQVFQLFSDAEKKSVLGSVVTTLLRNPGQLRRLPKFRDTRTKRDVSVFNGQCFWMSSHHLQNPSFS